MESKSPILSRTSYFLLFMLFLFGSACSKTPPRTSHELPPSYTTQKLSAYSQVRIERKGKAEFFDAAFKIIAPNQLTLKMLDDLGEVRLSLVADGDQITYQSGDEYQQIPQNEDSLKKTLHLPLTVEEFVRRMLETENPSYEKSENSKKWKYRVHYREYSQVSKKQFPHQIEWEFRKPHVRILMNLSEIEID